MTHFTEYNNIIIISVIRRVNRENHRIKLSLLGNLHKNYFYCMDKL